MYNKKMKNDLNIDGITFINDPKSEVKIKMESDISNLPFSFFFNENIFQNKFECTHLKINYIIIIFSCILLGISIILHGCFDIDIFDFPILPYIFIYFPIFTFVFCPILLCVIPIFGVHKEYVDISKFCVTITSDKVDRGVISIDNLDISDVVLKTWNGKGITFYRIIAVCKNPIFLSLSNRYEKEILLFFFTDGYGSKEKIIESLVQKLKKFFKINSKRI